MEQILAELILHNNFEMRILLKKEDKHRPLFFCLTKIFLFAFLLFLLSILYCPKINLTIADLGRHIQNGAVTLSQGFPVSTNYYSYTEPAVKVVNHHWGAGVVFYWVWRFFGFEGLSVFYCLLLLLSFLLFFKIARDMSNFSLAFFFSVLSIPMITSRLEIRPEGFSYVLAGLYLNVLYRYKVQKLDGRWLWAIPFLQVLWINLHGYFIFGILLVGFFCIDAWLNENRGQLKQLFKIELASVFACFLNPFGWQGVVVPFKIFEKPTYTIIENMSVFVRHKMFPDHIGYIHFEVMFFILILLLCFMGKEQLRKNILPILIMGFFSTLAWSAIRFLAMWGFFYIPITAGLCFSLLKNWSIIKKTVLNRAALITASLVLVCSIIFKSHYYSLYNSGLFHLMSQESSTKSWFWEGLKNLRKLPGLLPDSNASANFFKKQQLKGPIFNNFDIGGYLIFHLFPQERVFMDNRPEAYSASFFKSIYVPMQNDEAVWQKMDELFGFNAIYFQHQDATRWAKPFLARRMQDPEWALVHIDSFAVILLKRNEQNAAVIARYNILVK